MVEFDSYVGQNKEGRKRIDEFQDIAFYLTDVNTGESKSNITSDSFFHCSTIESTETSVPFITLLQIAALSRAITKTASPRFGN